MINKDNDLNIQGCNMLSLLSKNSMRNYLDRYGPKFRGNFADNHQIHGGIFKVVSFNIKFGEKVDHAIYELSEFEELRNADIILLQEMDANGTECIAKTLNYNYIYYPASVHTHHDKFFGNAILSKWLIQNEEKVILPHENPKNGQRRIATSATIKIGKNSIEICSVHTETLWLQKLKRLDQVENIKHHILKLKDIKYAIIGGDFNTLEKKDINATTRIFKTIGFDWATESVGSTSKVLLGLKKTTLDHIYTKGMKIVSTGKVEATKASDHFPVWVTLRI
jgi:endonuclease/exonuclease/phosphatase family metal-dependent hydrolase